MSRALKLLIVGLLVIGGLAAWLLMGGREERVVVDLAAGLAAAKERRPTPDIFSVVTATLADEELRAIQATHPADGPGGSRLKWDVAVPEDAWFAFSIGLMPEAWTTPGDGVLFRVGVSDVSPGGPGYEEVFSAIVNPFGNPGDRRWLHLTVDLSPYAGKTVELILNTNASPPAPPGTPGADDRAGDLALWGEPRVIVR